MRNKSNRINQPLGAALKQLILVVVPFIFGIVPAAASVLNSIDTSKSHLEDPEFLSEVEQNGFSFSQLISGKGNLNNHQFYNESTHSILKQISAILTKDLDKLAFDLKQNKVPFTSTVVDGRVRILDLNWLQSPIGSFKLTGIINRLDRRDFSNHTDCGELRFIYRLEYVHDRGRPTQVSSRLPFLFNLIYKVPLEADGNCTEYAKIWQGNDDSVVGSNTINKITREKEIFRQIDFSRMQFKQLEMNAQVIRFPSELGEEMGGKAIYLLRIFDLRRNSNGIEVLEKTLENTPDLAKIQNDSDLKSKLKEFILKNIGGIDLGVFRLPEEFLATVAFSHSTFGNSRLANKPFSEIFSVNDFANLPTRETQLINSSEGLLERLNNSTCMGCHQSGATAGFHFLGNDGKNIDQFNRLQFGMSPHFLNEITRRSHYLAQYLKGESNIGFRSLSFSPKFDFEKNQYTAARATEVCIPDSDSNKFKNTWSCKSGLKCKVLAYNKLLPINYGQCLYQTEMRDRNSKLFSGHPCFSGEIKNGRLPFLDSLTKMTKFAAPYVPPGDPTTPEGDPGKNFSPYEYACPPTNIGVPGGMSYRMCTGGLQGDHGFNKFKPNMNPDDVPEEICGFAGGKTFDKCAASGNFATCLESSIARGNRSTCNQDMPCRDDYICQSLPDKIQVPNKDYMKKYGFCTPTYFFFQLRLDGHVQPK